MGRPNKNSDKAETDRLTREFVANLRLHSPQLSAAELERRLDLETECSPGQTLSRWARAGQGGRGTTLDRLQVVTKKAQKLGLLPPPRRGGLVRYDPAHSTSEKRASEILSNQLAQARDLDRSRAAAIAAMAAYASAIEGAVDWLVVDTAEDSEVTGRPCERRGADVLSLARQLETHEWVFHPISESGAKVVQ